MGHSPNIYSILGDHHHQNHSSMHYADLQLQPSSPRGPPPSTKPKPSLPPTLGPPTTSSLHHATLANLYQPIGLPNPPNSAQSSRTLHYPNYQNHNSSSTASNSSITPPSSAANNSGHHHAFSNGGGHHHHSTTLARPDTLYGHHTYDRPDALKQQQQQQQQQSYYARLASSASFGPSSAALERDDGVRTASRTLSSAAAAAAGRSSLYHPNDGAMGGMAGMAGGGMLGHCEYAILRFDEPPSPPSQC